MKIRIILAVVIALGLGFGVVTAEDQMIIKLKSGAVETYNLVDIDSVLFNNDTTLVAHYPFNGSADDMSGNGLNGTVHGATLTQDRFGRADRAYHFSAHDSTYISVEDNDLLDFGEGQDFAIVMWIKTSFQGESTTALSKYSGSRGPQMVLDPSGLAQCWGRDPEPRHVFTQSVMNDGVWHLLVGMRQGSVWSMWADGVKDDEIDTQSMGSLGNDMSLVIGVSNFGNSPLIGYWEGDLDDISIYRRALSEAEIQGLFNRR